VKLSAKVGFTAQGKVLTKTVEDRPEESVVRFNHQEVEKSLNETLTSALGRLIDAAISSAEAK
jgi:hydrogenase maturation factor HypF (carbamoyltransferase family)